MRRSSLLPAWTALALLLHATQAFTAPGAVRRWPRTQCHERVAGHEIQIVRSADDERPRCTVIDRIDVLTPYHEAWELQKELLERRLAPGGESLRDCLLLVQHPPVYTLGTGSTLDHLKFNIEDSPFEIFRVERGGEVTYHGPGQVVLYPLLDLRRYKQDVHWYMRALEEVVIRALAKLGVRGERIAGLTGVWVGGAKVAAIGVKIRRWHTMHGLALNVHPDLAHFRHIVPCGIGALPVGSLEQLVAGGVTALRACAALLDAFAEVFDAELQVEETDGGIAAAVAQAEAAGGG